MASASFGFGRRLFIHETPDLVILFIVILSLGFAALSWKFIEQPFRNRSAITRSHVFIGSAVSIGGVALFSIAATSLNFADNRTTMAGHTTKWLQDMKQTNYGLNRQCHLLEKVQSGECSVGQKAEYILWGDSYAMHLAQALTAGSYSFTQLTMSACAPVIGLAPHDPVSGRGWGSLEWGDRCQDYNDMALDFMLKSEADKVILSSPFGLLTSKKSEYNVRGTVTNLEDANPRDAFLSTLQILLQHGKDVVIVSPMPRPPYMISDCVIRSSFLGKPTDQCSFPQSIDGQTATYDALGKVSEESGVPIVYLRDFVCNEGKCAVDIMGTPLYRDSSHMSPSGSFAFGQHTGFLNAVDRAFENYDLVDK